VFDPDADALPIGAYLWVSTVGIVVTGLLVFHAPVAAHPVLECQAWRFHTHADTTWYEVQCKGVALPPGIRLMEER
jgi:hypothetical protein